MKRFFSSRQRKMMRFLAGNRCAICNLVLSDEFHADHIVPFSKSSKTVVSNGQALCPKCNLEKGVRDGRNSS
ncbi:MAG: HNH endonuclease [Candidatus Puniceispirillaceae bacterium]